MIWKAFWLQITRIGMSEKEYYERKWKILNTEMERVEQKSRRLSW